MATVYVIWDRKAKSFAGGNPPRLYTSSQEATDAARRGVTRAGKGDLASSTFDAVAVTI